MAEVAGTKEIKSRIQSVQETKKITNAMYLIASTKLRRARQELENTRPYFKALRGEIKRIFRTADDVDSRYFYPPGAESPLVGTYGCLVITADKGLAGAYNQNAIRQAQQLLEQARILGRTAEQVGSLDEAARALRELGGLERTEGT